MKGFPQLPFQGSALSRSAKIPSVPMSHPVVGREPRTMDSCYLPSVLGVTRETRVPTQPRRCWAAFWVPNP